MKQVFVTLQGHFEMSELVSENVNLPGVSSAQSSSSPEFNAASELRSFEVSLSVGVCISNQMKSLQWEQ